MSSPLRGPRRAPGSTPLSRRLLLALGAAAPAAGALAIAGPVHADPSVSGGETRVVDVELSAVDGIETEDGFVREVNGHTATMVGATWADTVEEPTVRVRGLQDDGTWSPWYELEIAIDPESGDRAPGTEVAWLGAVSAVQVRAEADGVEVTDELTVHLVTTSPTTSDSSRTAGVRALSTTSTAQVTSIGPNPATPPLATRAPAFVSRAQWGADESTVRQTVGADALRAVVIHHTAGTNSYSAATSPQIVRGILSYHTQTLGWADIGYNVLVDKYGTIFEGRGGGLHRNIAGAHASGFNTGSFGISVMGDYSSAAPPWAARAAVSRIAGWKLRTTFRDDAFGFEEWTAASGTRFTPGTRVTLPRLFGHRDVNHTECPGAAFYSGLDGIRTGAAEWMAGAPVTHRNAFTRAGGESVLGTVTHGAHLEGQYTVTKLTQGLVVSDARGVQARRSDFVDQWTADWGRPLQNPSTREGRPVQVFDGGLVVGDDAGAAQLLTQRYSDVSPRNAYFLDIEELAAARVIREARGRVFRARENCQRSTFFVYLHRAMGSPSVSLPATSPFTDVSTTSSNYRPIVWAYQSGLVSRFSDGTFRPEQAVRRDRIAAFLYRAAGSPAGDWASAQNYRDVPAGYMHAVPIGWLVAMGISRGSGSYGVSSPLAREQVAAFIARWMRVTGRL